ncbi:MAG: tetratricopeptide repeat protein [Xenococcaceae cyanobacterium]
MDWQNKSLINPLSWPGQVILLEAESGRARANVLKQWLEESQCRGAKTWFLSCDFDFDGVWAGLKDLLQELVREIQNTAPELIDNHSYELTCVLPSWRRQISVRNANLTDTAPKGEKIRNYPAERAYRILHGVINLLDAWYQYSDASPWVIACDNYDRAGALVRRFFPELIRRRGQSLNLTLLIAVECGQDKAVSDQFDCQVLGHRVRLNLPLDEIVPISKVEMSNLAQDLEQQVCHDDIEIEIHLPKLIRYWLLSDQPEKAHHWQMRGLEILAHHGFYEDALVYGACVTPQLGHLCPEDSVLRWNIVNTLFSCHAALRNIEKAHQLLVEEALTKITAPSQRVRLCYVMALFYSRILPQRNFEKGMEYLEQALEILAKNVLPESEQHFLNALILNGLAFIRHRQKRSMEAVEICRSAIKQLNDHLPRDQHRLYRSVLLYNIAQVYAAIGPLSEAIAHFTAAQDIDPNYSEYYNERGNLYLKMGRLDDALNDYRKAIDLSPPYGEVWINLGLCYRLKGQLVEAAEAYSIALDLNPTEVSTFIGRAQVLEALGKQHAALDDYNTALTLSPDQPSLLANRACLKYDMGNLSEALSDLDQAIALSPETPDLYHNRAVALTALCRFDDAVRDLQTYLKLKPDAEDFIDVEREIATLQTILPD